MRASRKSFFAVFTAILMLILAGNVSAEIVFEEGIEYSNPNEQHLKLNLARPAEVKAGDKLPAVVCIHGGGFRAGDRKGWDGFCKKLAENGYVAVTVTYRLAPKHQYPAAVYDVKAAVQWVRKNAEKYHIDPERIGTVGDSAGGHLALFLGVTGDVPQFQPPEDKTTSTRVQCVVSFYGPSDFTKSYGKSVDAAEVLPLWLGGDLQHEKHRHIESSPLNWVTPQAAPTLLLHGTEDKYVNYEQAIWMRDRLAAADVEVKLVTFEGSGHGFKPDVRVQADKETMAFFDAHLKKKP